MEIKDIAEYEEKDSRLARNTIAELHQEIESLNNIIKEVRKYIMTNGIHSDYGDRGIDDENKLLEILDKADKGE